MEVWVERADGMHVQADDGRIFFDAEWVQVIALVKTAAPVLRLASRARTSIEAPSSITPLADGLRARWQVNARTLMASDVWRLAVVERGEVLEESVLMAHDEARAAALVQPANPTFEFRGRDGEIVALDDVLAEDVQAVLVRWHLAHHGLPPSVLANLAAEVLFRAPNGGETRAQTEITGLGPQRSLVTARLEAPRGLVGGSWLVLLRLGGKTRAGGRLELRGIEAVHADLECVVARYSASGVEGDRFLVENARQLAVGLVVAPRTLPFRPELVLRGVVRVVGDAGGVLAAVPFTFAPDLEHEGFMASPVVGLPSRAGTYQVVTHVGNVLLAAKEIELVSPRQVFARARAAQVDVVRLDEAKRPSLVGDRLGARERAGRLAVRFHLEFPEAVPGVTVPIRVALVDERGGVLVQAEQGIRLDGGALAGYAPPLPLAAARAARRMTVRLEVDGRAVFVKTIALEHGGAVFDGEGGIVGAVAAAVSDDAAEVLEAFFPLRPGRSGAPMPRRRRRL